MPVRRSGPYQEANVAAAPDSAGTVEAGSHVAPSVGTNCVSPPHDMVAWYPFDEVSGTTAVNRRGPSPIANLLNSPTHVPGKVGYALKFDGLNDVARSTTPHPNIGLGDFSIDFWMNTSSSTGTHHVLEKRTRPAKVLANILGYAVAITNGKLLLQIGNGSTVGGGYTNYVSNPSSVADGVWHHVAVTVSRTDPNGIKFYVDGALKSTADPTNRQGDLSNTALLTIGEDTFGIVSRYKGILDELEIFSRALTPAEVSSIYAAGAAGKCKVSTAYVANNSASTVTPVAVPSNQPGIDIPVPGARGGPEYLAITPDGAWAYVVRTGFGGDIVTPVDLTTNTADSPISLNSPIGIAITPDGKWAYVATPHNLVAIDLLNGNSIGTSIPIPGRLFDVAITPDGKWAWVTNASNSSVTQVNLITNVPGVTLSMAPNSGTKGIAITPDGKWAYVMNSDADTVVPINLVTKALGPPIQLPAQTYPNRVAINPNGGAKAYVTGAGTQSPGKVYPITIPNNVLEPAIAVGTLPSAIAITLDGQWAYVASPDIDTVHPINISATVPVVGAPITIPGRPSAIGIRPA